MLGLGNLQGKTHWIGAKPDHLGFRRQQKIGTGSVHSTWRRSQYFIYIYTYNTNTMQCNAMQCNAMPYHTIPYHTIHTIHTCMHACRQYIHTYIHALHCIALHYITYRHTYIHHITMFSKYNYWVYLRLMDWLWLIQFTADLVHTPIQANMRFSSFLVFVFDKLSGFGMTCIPSFPYNSIYLDSGKW